MNGKYNKYASRRQTIFTKILTIMSATPNMWMSANEISRKIGGRIGSVAVVSGMIVQMEDQYPEIETTTENGKKMYRYVQKDRNPLEGLPKTVAARVSDVFDRSTSEWYTIHDIAAEIHTTNVEYVRKIVLGMCAKNQVSSKLLPSREKAYRSIV